MDVGELSLKWAEHRYRLMTFEEQKEEELRSKFPELSDSEIDHKVATSVNRRFKQESRQLMRNHFVLTELDY